MSHIDFTRWKPEHPPTLHEVLKTIESVDPDAAEVIRAGEDINVEVFCRHTIDIPDLFERDTERSCMGVNIYWHDPAHPDIPHGGMAALQVSYQDVLGSGQGTVDTFINPRHLHLDEALMFAHLLTIGVYPRPAGVSWTPIN